MAISTHAPGLSQEAVETLSTAKHEPSWMHERRLTAWRLSQELNWPLGTEEEWRRTDLRGLVPEQYQPLPPQAAAVSQREALPACVQPHMALPETPVGGLLVHQDGSSIWQTHDAALLEQGVIFCDLDTAVQQHAALVEAHFMRTAVPVASDKFTALHAALWNGGTFLYVPPGVSVSLPLHALTVHMTAAGMEQSHILVIADRGSQVTMVAEELSGSADLPGFHNGVVELYLKAEARVTYLQLQNWSRRLWSVSHQRAVLGTNSQLRWAVAGLGSRLSWTAQSVLLQEPGSQAKLFGLVFADGRQHLDYQTQQDHRAPHTESDLLFRSALLERARTVLRGVVHLRKEAQQTNAYQSTHSLVLSDKARADAIPILEIEADDVRCKHGATTGMVDDEQIFYLMSRGLSRAEAQRMIVQGFFETVITEFPVEGVQEKIRLAIENRI
ncbi:MAG: Fe-S cluster assembly protein SufD [Candidatus Tectimicrobiota bacterium]